MLFWAIFLSQRFNRGRGRNGGFASFLRGRQKTAKRSAKTLKKFVDTCLSARIFRPVPDDKFGASNKPLSPGGGIGRRAGFRCQWPQGRGSSSLLLGTIPQYIFRCAGVLSFQGQFSVRFNVNSFDKGIQIIPFMISVGKTAIRSDFNLKFPS